MRKFLRVAFIVLVIGFVAIQFFQPEKNNSEDRSNHFFQKEQVPPQIESIITNACLDCHSNETRYVWYHNIAPVSWLVNKDITEGKEHLNFSEWGEKSVINKITLLDEICEETEQKAMPLKLYRLAHKKAKLSEDQINELCAFTTRLSEELLAKENN